MIPDSTLYDLAIIGGGPAAVAAGVYASRKRLKTVFITKEWGGQSTVSADIQNWIGTPSIAGELLAKNLKGHLTTYADEVVAIREGESAQSVEKSPEGNSSFPTRLAEASGGAREGGSRVGEGGGFLIKTDKSEYRAKTVLIATGSKRRRLEVPGADRFEHKGVVYCASCDGPLFADMDVAVVGGGNAGFETAAQLLAYCKSVVLLHKNDEFKADPSTVQKVLSNPKMHAVRNAEILEVKGSQFVEAIVYREKDTGKQTELPVQGVFVETGSVPLTDLVGNLVKRDMFNQIIVDPRNQRASVDGVWAAGDCTDGLYHQNNIAAGDAVKALEDIYMWLHAK